MFVRALVLGVTGSNLGLQLCAFAASACNTTERAIEQHSDAVHATTHFFFNTQHAATAAELALITSQPVTTSGWM